MRFMTPANPAPHVEPRTWTLKYVIGITAAKYNGVDRRTVCGFRFFTARTP